MLWRVKSRPGRLLPASFIPPCIPTAAVKVPSGPGWIHEIKHDGYRMQLRKNGDRVQLFTRRGFDWTERYPRIVAAAKRIKAKSFSIDGETVVADDAGVPDFAKLHSRCFDREAYFYAFDLLEHDGADLKRMPLIERKAALAKLLRRAPAGVHLCEHDEGDGAALFRAACRMGLEGIISKRAGSFYRSGRAQSWVKIKNKSSPGYLRVHDNLEG